MSKPVFLLLCILLTCTYHCHTQENSRLMVYFDSDRSLIRNDAKDSLQKLLQTLRSAGNVTQIEIAAHCDGRGTEAYNLALSDRRATAVEAFLRSNGLAAGIPITKQALGEMALLNTDQRAEDQAMNRRAEIILHIAPAPPPPPAPPAPAAADTTEVEEMPAPVKDTVIGQLFDPTAYENIKVGDQLILNNINFQPGRHVLLSWSMPNLEELLKVMKDHPTLKIEIQGHICCINTGADGPDADLGTYNLSEERAKTVYRYLIDKGIRKSRLSYKGFGSRQKLYPYERTEKERTLNRRVEIKILSK
ncbi:OmpA family protein [Terrimonas sp. NA20]|uniref:OmpA family protein n=1 Tax=Terrimonas ginsenosidimutans TaxID=2908004 RepID=A0ABS9KU62_9BACT|nr:OmpA family protein [Terrimonas ginsenosidimutans]MCG2615823.1 OmpA family protein [Terrimonas ginsenosidimutans]